MFFENETKTLVHLPVLKSEILTFLQAERGGWFIDCTLGLGGHTEALLQANETVHVLALDRDVQAANQALARLAPYSQRVHFVHSDFRELPNILAEQNLTQVSGILADLGISSWQLGQPERGFSFQQNGPLDMRMDTSQELTAAKLVNLLSASELADLIYTYGEERASRRIAQQIVLARSKKPFETTQQLADLVRKSIPSHGRPRIDPATRTFQALRIAVNRELDHLNEFVSHAVDHLAPGGRLAIITFHSLEDRLIKHAMRYEAGITDDQTEIHSLDWIKGVEILPKTKRVTLITRKPVTASEEELAVNPRARSAKLRVCEKI